MDPTGDRREVRFKQMLLVYAAILATILAACLVILTFHYSLRMHGHKRRAVEATPAAASTLPAGYWRFIVSGDSRNCGDVVMPTIAAHSAQFSPGFYWHLGDLRAIYKIDEDMAFAAANNAGSLSCENYHQLAWSDFIQNQIAPFGRIPFYVGIGNHEIIPPMTEDTFKRSFAGWLDQSTLREQRQKDGEPSQPETYYHWIQGGVDFIYLDNASNSFTPEQVSWLHRRLDSARTNSAVKSVVVGMHEALPGSLANSHSMGDKGLASPGTVSGEEAYQALVKFRDESRKPVYVLASHSHFYMENIFDTDERKKNDAKPLPGWIVGTGGAVRYKLPDVPSPIAMTDIYGYLVGTVAPDGSILFAFQEVREPDVPQYVRQRYTNALVPWCFAYNSQARDIVAKDVTPLCETPKTSAATTSAH